MFIDHGTGVVIGETAEVAAGVVIYQGVTLGGTGKEKGKRHPTIERDVVISSGAKVLGGFTVGEGAKIGAGAVVLKEVPPHATVVGVPGRVVRIRGDKPDLQQEKVDPNAEEIRRAQTPHPQVGGRARKAHRGAVRVQRGRRTVPRRRRGIGGKGRES